MGASSVGIQDKARAQGALLRIAFLNGFAARRLPPPLPGASFNTIRRGVCAAPF
jgi:hypothetical protein